MTVPHMGSITMEDETLRIQPFIQYAFVVSVLSER